MLRRSRLRRSEALFQAGVRRVAGRGVVSQRSQMGAISFMHLSLRTRRLLVAVPTALLAVSLVGCGDIAEKAAEDALKDEGIDADIDGSDISIEGTDFNITTGKLPKDFPVDEVPVVDRKILQGAYTKNSQTWDTTIEVGPAGGDKQAAYDAAEEKLGADVLQEPI